MNMHLIFNRHLHKKYFLRIIQGLPSSARGMDMHRIIALYFAISGLDLLDEIDSIPDERKKTIIDWIYSLQVTDDEELVSGFQGSTTFNTEFNRDANSIFKWGHIVTTYSALCTLVILGDDLERVNRDSVIKSLRARQLPSGSYVGAKEGTENDMRFVYSAACICYILDDWTGMDIEKTTSFILESMSYDFGIGQGPGLESHCGSTFCAIATLALTEQLHKLTSQQRCGLERWLLNRLERFGFAGRPNKPEDTCYSFWTGGALKILGIYQFIDAPENRQFVLATQGRFGGFSKWVNTQPDPLHSYLGLAGLSFMGVEGVSRLFPELNVSLRAFQRLTKIHDRWRV